MAKKEMLNKKYPPIVAVWIDSCEWGDNSEISLSDVPEPQTIIQCGFLIKDEEDYIAIAGAVKNAPSEVFDYVISIPRFAVKEIIKLK